MENHRENYRVSIDTRLKNCEMRLLIDHLYDSGFSYVGNGNGLNQHGARIDVDGVEYGILVTEVEKTNEGYDVIISVEGPHKDVADRLMEELKEMDTKIKRIANSTSVYHEPITYN